MILMYKGQFTRQVNNIVRHNEKMQNSIGFLSCIKPLVYMHICILLYYANSLPLILDKMSCMRS